MSKGYYIIPIFVPHEGCPHNCVFCNQDRITGITERMDKEKAREIIEEYLETIPKDSVKEISFFGGTFTAIEVEKQKRLLSLAKEYKDAGKIDKIRMSTRPDAINEYILKYLNEYTVDIIELGVQSLNDDVLVSAGRGHTVQDVINASRLIKEYGITLGHQLMPGLPNSNRELDIKSAEMSIEMMPDIVRIYPSLVIKDTPMEIMYSRGEYIPYSLEEAIDVSRIMNDMFKENNIQVIRIGLQPTESINEGGDIVSGPFHPAFRDLVESQSLILNIEKMLRGHKKAELYISNKDIGTLYANKKMFFNKLLEQGYKIKVIQDQSLKRGQCSVKIDK
ncbi:MAG: elongator complex protein 3 [Clostridium sp.]